MNISFFISKNRKFAPCLFILLSLACNSGKEKLIPGANIAGIRTSISRILISPLAFDAAVVAVDGLSRDIERHGDGEEEILFKLSDFKGNFINVSIKGSWQLMEGDYVIVGGIYRRNENKIEADQLEKVILEEP